MSVGCWYVYCTCESSTLMSLQLIHTHYIPNEHTEWDISSGFVVMSTIFLFTLPTAK